MKLLYIFPHPDDESFGPAAAMNSQLKEGHEVYLLTLTKGGATKQRFKMGLSIDEMGEIRYKEMIAVKNTLRLSGMEVLDLPDSGLKEMDPRDIEKVISQHASVIKPDIVITYAVHGISGFHDHLVSHAIVKRLFLQMKDEGHTYLKRLAFFTLPDKGLSPFIEEGFRMKHSDEEHIDCIITISEDDINMMKNCLKCYETYRDVIEESGVVEKIGNKIYFELFNENFVPPLENLTAGL